MDAALGDANGGETVRCVPLRPAWLSTSAARGQRRRIVDGGMIMLG